MVDEMKGHIFDLAKDQYGSLVLQKMLVKCESSTFDKIVKEMKGHIFDLAKNKYGSHVLQKIIDRSD